MPSTRFDLALCGGGVIGLSIAFQCLRKGWKVAVVDRADFGKEASWAGAGILPSGATIQPLDPLEQLRALSHPMHADWSKLLLELSGIDNEYIECGGLYIAKTPAERATLAANRSWWDEHGIPYERWDCSQSRVAVPDLGIPSNNSMSLNSSGSVSSTEYWWMPNDCRLRNPRHIQALLKSVEALGGQLVSRDGVERIHTHSGNARHAELKSGMRLEADRFCITAGAWTQLLLEPLSVQTGILPVRGQMVLYKLDAPIFSCIVNDGHRYLVPRNDGYVLAGSCEEEVGFKAETTESMIRDLKEWATSIVPTLGNAKIVRTWAGLRPGSFDGYPYIGQLPGVTNAYVASGHFRHGLHWSTGTALLMQQLLFEEPTAIDLTPFRVLRGFNSH